MSAQTTQLAGAPRGASGQQDAPRERRAAHLVDAARDRRVELLLGAVAVSVVALIGLILATVLINGWPSFAANGLSWFAPGGDIVTQFRAMQTGIPLPGHPLLYFRAWPLIWGTLLSTAGAVAIALVVSTLAAIFLTEFAPGPVRRVLAPVVRLLAGVPSVIYGLVGILAIVPWVNENLISNGRRQSVAYVVQLNGANLSTAILILTVMILPIMVALTANALASVPVSWREGSAALGVNRWRTIWRVSLRAARPAIAAGTVLATARALGEAVMLAMLSGGRPFEANPLDGFTFLFEPIETLAAGILQEFGGETNTPIGHTAYAMGALLLFSAAMLSFASWAVKQRLRRYGVGS
ncbi:MAG TPA: phosphate ABC transporter permease subunit PstC [Solirubrobacteraceae bacterium]|nr:phosphate ABC transporter permease subunit PstC [Solirubrobacteraceae bacterium]